MRQIGIVEGFLVWARLVEEYLSPEKSSGTARVDSLDLMAAVILN